MSRGNSSCFYLSLGKFVKFLQRTENFQETLHFPFNLNSREKMQVIQLQKKSHLIIDIVLLILNNSSLTKVNLESNL